MAGAVAVAVLLAGVRGLLARRRGRELGRRPPSCAWGGASDSPALSGSAESPTLSPEIALAARPTLAAATTPSTASPTLRTARLSSISKPMLAPAG